MDNNERKPTWLQTEMHSKSTRIAYSVRGSHDVFVNLTKEVTQESDVDVVLAFEIDEAIDEFDYDGRHPETIETGGSTRELDLIIGGPESDYDDGESELLYARPNDEFE
ncbi:MULTISPECIES: hypothetical protein [unclassified Haladaptatus]|uniref:hypothetical protein n=1 Tax=unclassified Haladaptatus TaxID=2622732 RepID=UPI00209BEECC|nr:MULTISPECIES: hypothetical protein [unclassified Haladaptatus]MCO8245406.1 hypothetical protein [Haladaptatus sp. AB643]MCO8256839.1 hypothetical protein [Haladaptatus sp. AB618]